jgi:hypothetical protein
MAGEYQAAAAEISRRYEAQERAFKAASAALYASPEAAETRAADAAIEAAIGWGRPVTGAMKARAIRAEEAFAALFEEPTYAALERAVADCAAELAAAHEAAGSPWMGGSGMALNSD